MNKTLYAVLALAMLFSAAFAADAEAISFPVVREEAPNIAGVLVNGEPLKDATVFNEKILEQGILFTFIYSQHMDFRVVPKIEFTGSSDALTQIDSPIVCDAEGGVWNEKGTEYSLQCFLLDRKVTSVAMRVRGAASRDGVAQSEYRTTMRFDFTPPVLADSSVSLGDSALKPITVRIVESGIQLVVSADISEQIDMSSLHVSFSDPAVNPLIVYNRTDTLRCSEGTRCVNEDGTYNYKLYFNLARNVPYQGSVFVTIYGAQDAAGNQMAPEVIRELHIDTAPPQVSSFSILPPFENGINVESLNSGESIRFMFTFDGRMDTSVEPSVYFSPDAPEFNSLINYGRCNEETGTGWQHSGYAYALHCRPDPRVGFQGAFRAILENAVDGMGNPLAGGNYFSPSYPVDSLSPVVRAEVSYGGFDYADFSYEVPANGVVEGVKITSCWYVLDDGKEQKLDCVKETRGISDDRLRLPSEEFAGILAKARAPVFEGAHALEVFVQDSNGRIGSSGKIKFEAYIVNHDLDSNITVSHDESTVFVLPSSPAATITVPSGVSRTVLDFAGVRSNGTATAPSDLTITVNTTNGTITLVIPAGTAITGSAGWDGQIALPALTAAFIPVNSTGYENATSILAIDVGSSSNLTFDKPVKLVLPGQAGKFAGFQQGSTFTEITATCNSATVPTNAVCKIDAGSDLVIWTDHFTLFGAYTQSAIPAAATQPSVVASTASNSNGGGNVYIPYVAPQSPEQEAPAQAPEQPAPQAPAPTPAPAQTGNLAPTPLSGEQQLVPESPLAAALSQPPEQQSDLVASLFGANGIVTGAAPVIAVVGAVALAGGAVYMIAVNRKRKGL